MHAAGYPHSLPRPGAECLPLGPAQKNVWFDLTNDLGDALSLPMAGQSFVAATTKEYVSGWWEAPCSLKWLGNWDFLPHIHPPGIRNFWVTRQEETLTLVHALQHCAERMGMPYRVLCNVAHYLQRCMAPLMHLEDDKIVEALLLGLKDNRPTPGG